MKDRRTKGGNMPVLLARLMMPFLAGAVAVSLGACAPTTKRPNVSQVALKKEREIQTALYGKDTASPPIPTASVGGEGPAASRMETRSQSKVASGSQESELPEIAARGSGAVNLYDSAFKLWKAAAPMCAPRIRPGYGLVAATISDIREGRKAYYTDKWGMDGQPRIAMLLKGSPAAAAGLEPGDLIVAINGAKVASGGSGRKNIAALLAKTGMKPMKLTINRDRGEEPGERVVEITPVAMCDYSVHTTGSEKINASADGKGVFVTTGMMEFVENATELETVLGHELAHNIMQHLQAKEANVAIGTVIGLVLDVAIIATTGVDTDGAFTKNLGEIGQYAYSQGFEYEADYVGLYVMAKAGADYKNAPHFWRRMHARKGERFQLWRSHPTNAERFVTMAATVKEIDGKMAAGKPLKPEIKKRAVRSKDTPPVKQANGEIVE